MAARRCSCGFTEAGDELLTDHLELVFVPDDGIGRDGRRHEETDRLACSCGLAAGTVQELDRHFLAIFTPAGAIGRDGRRHAVRRA